MRFGSKPEVKKKTPGLPIKYKGGGSMSVAVCPVCREVTHISFGYFVRHGVRDHGKFNICAGSGQYRDWETGFQSRYPPIVTGKLFPNHEVSQSRY